jgi:hypothetical protein
MPILKNLAENLRISGVPTAVECLIFSRAMTKTAEV